jgi:hypothetical protein
VSTLQRSVLLLEVSTLQGPELHLDVFALQRSVLLLEVSTLQGPELQQDVSALQRSVLLLKVSTLQGPELQLDVSALQRLVLLLEMSTTQGPELHLAGRVCTTEECTAPNFFSQIATPRIVDTGSRFSNRNISKGKGPMPNRFVQKTLEKPVHCHVFLVSKVFASLRK